MHMFGGSVASRCIDDVQAFAVIDMDHMHKYAVLEASIVSDCKFKTRYGFLCKPACCTLLFNIFSMLKVAPDNSSLCHCFRRLYRF